MAFLSAAGDVFQMLSWPGLLLGNAIQETDRAYGRKFFVLSDKILHSHQDAEESVSDTYMKTWETIPPQRPVYFFAYLAKLCRNFSLAQLHRTRRRLQLFLEKEGIKV